MDKTNDVIEIDVLELLMYYLRRWYIFVLAAVGTLVAGMAICIFLITPKYESTTKIIILNQQNSGSLTYSDMQLASQLTKDYEELIGSRDVLEQVITECGLEDSYETLLNRITIQNVTDTRIIKITVEDPSPAAAQTIANSIRETAAEHIRSVTDVEAVNMVETANFPLEQSSPSLKMWAVLSAAVGFLIVLIVLTVRYVVDDTIKTSEDVEKYLGLSTLALIPLINSGDGKDSKKKKRKKAKKTQHAG
ncbi:YveK family protein [uncultured Dysosmobacter sp.]|uniref:YveK family protein n=1 Tax=uncultured Dysosmobacter sp. TaxID=2591384 RepID=UPI0026116CA3|nr:Wzz/FepE/Etk N-terminal domain-containing protein [uncultured Dysosmobacter sp.]